MITSRLSLYVLLVGLAICLVGCKARTAKEPIQSTPPTSTVKDQPAENNASKEAPTAEASPDVSSGLAELSVEDREAAKKQRICPVSGELLGLMGKPIKTTVKGITVFLCCEGCEKDLKENPDKYLAKLKEAEEKN